MIDDYFRTGCGCSFKIQRSEITENNLHIGLIACPAHEQLMLGYAYRLADEARYRTNLVEMGKSLIK